MTAGHELVRMARRIYLTVARGRVQIVDDSGPVQKAQVDLGPQGAGGSDGLRDKTALLSWFGFTANPPLQSDVIVLCVGGDRSNAVGVAVNSQAYRLKNLNPGEVAVYDQAGNIIKLTTTGITVTDKWGNSVALAQGQMTLTHQTKVIIDCPAVELGAAGGPAVARVGDTVNLTTGVIETGSAKVTAA